MRVLVVEDEEKLAALIRQGLESAGSRSTSPTPARTRSGWPARPPTT